MGYIKVVGPRATRSDVVLPFRYIGHVILDEMRRTCYTIMHHIDNGSQVRQKIMPYLYVCDCVGSTYR